ncbi:MAG: S8 family serine peptidase [Clostridiales bacterium]|nr:S8 family serine peptidase [Clostridiales bacterium]
MKEKMNKLILLLITTLLLLSLSIMPGTAAPGANPLISAAETPWPQAVVPGQLLVGMETPTFPVSSNLFPSIEIESVRDITDVSGYSNANQGWTYPGRQILLIEIASTNEADMRAAIELLENYPSVAYAEPNPIGSACATSANTEATIPWNLEKIQAALAWTATTGSQNVLIAHMDSGADSTHPALAGKLADQLGYNFLYDNPFWQYSSADPIDDYGHGTHVSGILCANGNNDEGVVGICPDTGIVPLKIWDSMGKGSVAEFITALAYADSIGAQIVSLSGGWAGIGDLQAMQDAISAYSGLIVAAAGNSANDNDHAEPAYYPASFSNTNILSVAASDQTDNLCVFSNYGAASVDLAAPGSEILSAVNYWLWDIEEGWYTEPDYAAFSGTSAAVPQVAGTAALLLSLDPNLSTAQVKEAILNSADYCPALEGLVATNGRLNTYAALAYIGQPGQPVPTDYIEFTQNNYYAQIKSSANSTITVFAEVKEQNGTILQGQDVTYSIDPPYSGVSINSSSGAVTIAPTTAAGTAIITAGYGNLATAHVRLTLSEYTYTVYLEPEGTDFTVGSNFLVDVMIIGNTNYAQVSTEITYDSNLLGYVGYTYLHGWAASVIASTPGTIALNSVPSPNIVIGGPSFPAVRIATLKFTVLDNLAGSSEPTSLGFASLIIMQPGGMPGAMLAEGKPVTITLYE